MQTSTAQGTADSGLFIPIEPSLISSRNAQQSVPSKRNLSGNERERSLGFRFDKVDYMIKGWECYKLTKINRVYFTPAIFIESKELTPPIGYVATEDGEQRFSFSLQHRKNFVDNRIGTCWVEDLNEFLNTQFGQEFRTDRCSQSFLKRTSSNPNSRSIITVTANLNLEIKGDLLRYSSISIFDIKCNM